MMEELREMNVCDECVPSVPDQRWWIQIEPTLRWLRAKVGEEYVADSKRALLVKESGKAPLYYFPREDVRFDLLRRSENRLYAEGKGMAAFWDLVMGDRVIPNAVWGFEKPESDAAVLANYVTFAWTAVDHWYEEEEEVFGHARDPYTRVDEIASSRRIQVTINGQVVADSVHPVIVFETGLIPRYYLPAEDIRMDLLIPSDLTTRCPYKGEAHYWSVQVDGKLYEDVVWGYPEPVPELPKIKGLYSFYNEKIDRLTIDGRDWQEVAGPDSVANYNSFYA